MNLELLRRRLKPLRLSALSRGAVNYWLSLSEDGEVPQRAAFDPGTAGGLLRNCGLFDVRPGASVQCRIAGTLIKIALGSDLAGQDWIALTPPRYREQRLARYSAVAEGAIGVGRRAGVRKSGVAVLTEEVMLPFADVAGDGTRMVLVHTDWRPEGEEWFGIDPSYALGLADDFQLIGLE